MGKINFTIQKMTEADVEDVYKLGRATDELQVNDSVHSYYSVEDIKRAIKNKNNILLVAKTENDFIGFLTTFYHPDLDEAYFSDLAIKKNYRGFGIGKALLDECFRLTKTKNPGWAWALVQEDNKNMQKILEKRGFTKGKKFYFYYTHKI